MLLNETGKTGFSVSVIGFFSGKKEVFSYTNIHSRRCVSWLWKVFVFVSTIANLSGVFIGELNLCRGGSDHLNKHKESLTWISLLVWHPRIMMRLNKQVSRNSKRNIRLLRNDWIHKHFNHFKNKSVYQCKTCREVIILVIVFSKNWSSPTLVKTNQQPGHLLVKGLLHI